MADTTTATTTTPPTANVPTGGSITVRTPGTAPAGTPAPEGSLGAAVSGAPGPLDESDFKKDGTLRKDAIRRIEEGAPSRGTERSYNEVTGSTTVTTTVDGQTVTFEEEGDTTSDEPREEASGGLGRAMDNAQKAGDNTEIVGGSEGEVNG